jgi:hypothetical protein
MKHLRFIAETLDLHLIHQKLDDQYYHSTRNQNMEFELHEKRRRLDESLHQRSHSLTLEAIQTSHNNSLSLLHLNKFTPLHSSATRSVADNNSVSKPVTVSRSAEEKVKAVSAQLLLEGTQVEANYESNGAWYPGVIVKSHNDGTFNVYYEDDDSEEYVELKNIKIRNDVISFTKGMLINCQYMDKEWYNATIVGLNSNGNYDIIYSDGETENNVVYNRLAKQN